MAEGNWSVIRVEKISAEGAQKTERHNERKNESYANLNVDTEQIARNVHFKDTGGLTYNEYFQRLIDDGKISTRGQKAGATIFNELVIDVNTRYFEEHGGYEYAKQFYEEAYRFGCEIYGEENIVSAVMHADEINKAVSEGKFPLALISASSSCTNSCICSINQCFTLVIAWRSSTVAPLRNASYIIK